VIYQPVDTSPRGRLLRPQPRVTGPRLDSGAWPARADLIGWPENHGTPCPFGSVPAWPAGGGIATRYVSIEDFATAEPVKPKHDYRAALAKHQPIAMLTGLACPFNAVNTPQDRSDGSHGSTCYLPGSFSRFLRSQEYDVPILDGQHWGNGGEVVTWLGGECRLWEDHEGLWLTFGLRDNAQHRRILRAVRNRRFGLSVNATYNPWEVSDRLDVRTVSRVVRLMDVAITERPRFRQTWLRITSEKRA